MNIREKIAAVVLVTICALTVSTYVHLQTMAYLNA